MCQESSCEGCIYQLLEWQEEGIEDEEKTGGEAGRFVLPNRPKPQPPAIKPLVLGGGYQDEDKHALNLVTLLCELAS